MLHFLFGYLKQQVFKDNYIGEQEFGDSEGALADCLKNAQ